MKINNSVRKSKKIFVTIASVAAVAVIVGGYLLYQRVQANNNPASNTTKSTDYTPTTPSQKAAGTTIKGNSAANGISGSDQPPAPTPIPDSSKSNVTVTITSPSPQSGDTIYVNAFVGTVSNSGTCTLTFTNTSTSQVITKQVGVQASSTITTCKGFTLSKTADAFGAGQWTAVVSFSNDTLTGEATKILTIQ